MCKLCTSEFDVLANRWLSTEVPDHSFFMFIQLKANEKCGLNLATLESMVHGHKEEFKAHLLRMQSKALTELFFEKLKGNAAIEMAKQKLPPWLKSADFDSEFQWFLFRTNSWTVGHVKKSAILAVFGIRLTVLQENTCVKCDTCVTRTISLKKESRSFMCAA